MLLERLISNLVINAIMYNQPKGWVEVTVAAQPAQPVLTVGNSGLDIPAAGSLTAGGRSRTGGDGDYGCCCQGAGPGRIRYAVR